MVNTNFLKSIMTAFEVLASRPVVGSSRKRTLGEMINSIPMFVRLRSPPDTPRINSVPTWKIVKKNKKTFCILSRVFPWIWNGGGGYRDIFRGGVNMRKAQIDLKNIKKIQWVGGGEALLNWGGLYPPLGGGVYKYHWSLLI